MHGFILRNTKFQLVYPSSPLTDLSSWEDMRNTVVSDERMENRGHFWEASMPIYLYQY